MKKRIIAMLLACAAALSITACTDVPDNTDTKETEQAQTTKKTEKAVSKDVYAIGETWTVDGQWSLTVNSVTETDDRNQFSDKNPAAVYIVDYSYTNIGYEDKNGIMDGLYMSLDDSIVDNSGLMGYSYPGAITNYAQEAPVGATCNAQVCIGVDNPGDFQINVKQYDGNSKKQSAKFNIAVQ